MANDTWNGKLDFWQNQKNHTPRQAIINFENHATPTESPDPDELFQIPPSQRSQPPDATPVASQSSQQNALKRKLVDQQAGSSSGGNTSKKSFIEEAEDPLQSILGNSDLPSEVGSPSIVIPQRLNANKRMDVSITPFMDVIQSQGSQKSRESVEHSDSTLPSSMESPVISQRQLPTRSNRRVSGSVFQTAIQKARQADRAAAEISSDDSNMLSHIESPQNTATTRPGLKPKTRMSTNPFDKVLAEKIVTARDPSQLLSEEELEDSESFPSNVPSPEVGVSRRDLKSKKRPSSTGFNQALTNVPNVDKRPQSSSSTRSKSVEPNNYSSEEQFEDSESFPSNVPSPEVGATRRGLKSKKRPSSTGFKQALTNVPNVDEPMIERPQSSASTRSKLSKQQTSANADFEQSQHNVSEASNVRRSRRLQPSGSSSAPPAPPSAVKVIEETQFSPEEVSTQKPVPSPTDDIEQYHSPENLVQYSLSDEDEAVKIDEFSEVGDKQQHPAGQENSASLSFSNTTGNATGAGVADIEEEISSKVTTAALSANQPKFQRTFATARGSSSYTSETEAYDTSDTEHLFSPVTSPTHLVKKIATENLSDEDEDDSITEAATLPTVAQPTGKKQQTQKENSIRSDSDDLSMSELPSQLDSPAETNTRHRPGLASSKKNVSMTEFLAVLDPKKANARSSGDQPKKHTPTTPQVWIPFEEEEEDITSPPKLPSLESAVEPNRTGRRSSVAPKTRISGTSTVGDSSQGSTAPPTVPSKAKTPVPQMSTSPIATSPEPANEHSSRQEQNQTRRQSSRSSQLKFSSSQFVEDQNEKSSRNAAATTTPRKSTSRNSGTINKSASSASVVIPESEINSTRRSGPASNTRLTSSPSPEVISKAKTPSKTPIKSSRVDKTVEVVIKSSSSIAAPLLPEEEANSRRKSRSRLNTRSSTSHVAEAAPSIMETNKTAQSFREGQNSRSSTIVPVLEIDDRDSDSSSRRKTDGVQNRSRRTSSTSGESSASASNRSRRSLKFGSAQMTIADIRKSLIPEEDNEENPFEDATQSSARVTLSRRAGDKTNKTEATEEMEEEEEAVEETQSSDSEASTSNMDDEEENNGVPDLEHMGNQLPSPQTSPRRSNASSQKSSVTGRASNDTSPQRYPALVNSTVLPGGALLSEVVLCMSPIARYSNDKNYRLNVHATPSTPIPSNRKRNRSVSQSPMFISVMQNAIRTKATQELKASSAPTSDVLELPMSKPDSRKSQSVLSRANTSTGKGKALKDPRKAAVEVESSDASDWEDVDEGPMEVPRCIQIAFEKDIPDRTNNFVPLAERLKRDPEFQAKVKFQRAKMAKEKAAEEAAAAKKLAQSKPARAPRAPAKKKPEDNIASESVNKNNLRFYARTKVGKDALDSIHGLMGEWFEHTLDQMEIYLKDEGKESMDTWEDCYKLLKRQGIVKNYWEYSGLCHELLTNDECEKLLPSGFPPGHDEAKREAKRARK